MSRARLLFVACGTLLLTLPAAGDRPAPPTSRHGLESGFVAQWTVTFANGVVETCEMRADGTAVETEPLRSADGKTEVNDNALVITFADSRIERWTLINGRMVVEHWCPATAYPTSASVVGIADQAP